MPVFMPPLLVGNYPRFQPYGVSVTWNPSDKGASCSLANGNLDVLQSSSVQKWNTARATAGKTPGSGCWYWTCTEIQSSGDFVVQDMRAGIMNATAEITDSGSNLGYPGGTANGASLNGLFGTPLQIGYTQANNPATGAGVWGDTFMFALDMNLGMLWIGLNGVWGGNPTLRLQPWLTGISETVFAAGSLALGMNAGSSGTSLWRANFGATMFSYPAP